MKHSTTVKLRLYPGNPEGYELRFMEPMEMRRAIAAGRVTRDELWGTSDGFYIRMVDMCDSHLEAAIKDFQRAGVKAHRSLDKLVNELLRRRAAAALTSEGNNAVPQD